MRYRTTKYPYRKMDVGDCVVLNRDAPTGPMWAGEHYRNHEKAMQNLERTRGTEYRISYQVRTVTVTRVK